MSFAAATTDTTNLFAGVDTAYVADAVIEFLDVATRQPGPTTASDVPGRDPLAFTAWAHGHPAAFR